MFEKNLQGLVKGIRSAKTDPSVYISQCIQSIKGELKSTDQYVKAEAIRKLTYLHMMGYDMSWAAFHVVEVMSYERFCHKRVGYLAATQSFTQTTDVVLLCTNLLKKEFSSLNEYEVGIAINCLSNIVTEDLARDLLGDIVSMMNSANPYIRKKATLLLYKIYIRYPQGLRLTFDRLKERMDESEISVISCAVNVICELANKKPKNYLGLAPNFFRLLTTSSNNWMLIKVVKLMAALVPEEPRLARKLLDPLATIIQHTPAKSLLYECISTVTTALLYTRKSDGGQPRNVPAVVRLCNDHLRRYIEDDDQNLRYLGLVGLGNLMKSHPYVVTEHQEIILECLGVDDITIRMRALELVSGMITPDNSVAIISQLIRHTLSADGHYRDELIDKILSMCSRDKYNNVEDFEWYVGILVDLSHIQGERHGERIANQLIDIAVRVETVRQFAVKSMIKLLLDTTAMKSQENETMAKVLYAAAWISGEYAIYIEACEDSDEEDNSDDEDLPSFLQVVDAMLETRTTDLPPHVQAVYIQNVMKILAACIKLYEGEEDAEEDIQELATLIVERLPMFMQSDAIEVQERACSLHQLIISLGLGLGGLQSEERAAIVFDQTESSHTRYKILPRFFADAFAPVNPKAQRKVPIPDSIDLEKPFNKHATRFLEEEGLQMMEDSIPSGHVSFALEEDEPENQFYCANEAEDDYLEQYQDKNMEVAEQEYVNQRERMKDDPFYLPSGGSTKSIQAAATSVETSKKSKKKKKKKRPKQRVMMVDEVMPDGAKSSDEEEKTKKSRRKNKTTQDLADIDITVPLGLDEKIPESHLYHRQVKESEEEEPTRKKKSSKKTIKVDKKKKKKRKKTKEKTGNSSSTTDPNPEPLLIL